MKIDQQGITVPTVIITAVLALAGAGAGIVIYNAVGNSGGDINENIENVASLPETGLEDTQIGRSILEGDLNTGVGGEDREQNGDSGENREKGSGEEGETGDSQIAKSISAGESHVCVITGEVGSVYCWGDGFTSQRGSAEAVNVAQVQTGPAQMRTFVRIFAGESSLQTPDSADLRNEAYLTGAISVSAGAGHTCAVVGADTDNDTDIASDRSIYCWGDNSTGQLGNDETGSTTQTEAAQMRTPVRVVAGESSSDAPGAAGSANEAYLTGAVSVSAGAGYTCAVVDADNDLTTTSDRDAYCWGNNSFGQLGNGTEGPAASSGAPVKVLGGEFGSSFLTGVSAVAASSFHTCATVGSEADVYCWGRGRHGQLGNGKQGSNAGSGLPVRVRAGDSSSSGGHLTGVISFSAGHDHTCAITRDEASVFCWGRNLSGQLGIGSAGPAAGSSTPVRVRAKEPSEAGSYLMGAVSVSVGSEHTCAVIASDIDSDPQTASGRSVDCWGAGGSGQLGNGIREGSPIPVGVIKAGGAGLLTGNISVSAGGKHTCALVDLDGDVYCWGSAVT